LYGVALKIDLAIRAFLMVPEIALIQGIVPLESRMRGNLHVRFGGGRLETYLEIGNALTAYPMEDVAGSNPVSRSIAPFKAT
jgi:hypothetical protein